MAENVIFSISTELEFRGRELKALKPNKDGVYTGIPLSLIGTASRNNMVYERESFMECLTDPRSRFVMNLKSGDLEGEWGHPLLDVDPKKMVQRLLYLDRTKVSHHFTRIYAKEDKQTGYTILYGDVKPSGPFKQSLIDNFEDPTRNCSFSLRAATAISKREGGLTYKRMLALFTFDAVDGPGYVEASKRFRDLDASTESLNVNDAGIDVSCNRQEFLEATKAFTDSGMESKVVDQRVLDAFGCDEVIVRDKILRKVKGGFADSNGARVSVFDQAFGL